eukprot:1236983-Rhodomonas_salina.1
MGLPFCRTESGQVVLCAGPWYGDVGTVRGSVVLSAGPLYGDGRTRALQAYADGSFITGGGDRVVRLWNPAMAPWYCTRSSLAALVLCVAA